MTATAAQTWFLGKAALFGVTCATVGVVEHKPITRAVHAVKHRVVRHKVRRVRPPVERVAETPVVIPPCAPAAEGYLAPLGGVGAVGGYGGGISPFAPGGVGYVPTIAPASTLPVIGGGGLIIASPTPEPATWVTLGTGVVLAAGIAKRKLRGEAS